MTIQLLCQVGKDPQTNGKMLTQQKNHLQKNKIRNPILIRSVEKEGLIPIPVVEEECHIPILLLVLAFQVAMVVLCRMVILI